MGVESRQFPLQNGVEDGFPIGEELVDAAHGNTRPGGDVAAGAQGPWWRRPVTLFAPLWAYRMAFYRSRRPASEVRAQLAVEVLVVGAIVACAATGHLGDLAVLWAFPALVAVGFLAYAFDYLPHRPQDSTERFLDTRAYPSRALNVVLLGQNYHNVHHAWVSVPWFRYQQVFDAVRPDLEAIGVRVGRGSHRRPLDPEETSCPR